MYRDDKWSDLQEVGPSRYLLPEEEWRHFLESDAHRLPLLAAWADEHYATMLLLDNESPVLLSTPVMKRRYYAPSSRYPSALWGEVMARDLWGVEAIAACDDGAGFDEGSWTRTWPLSRGSLAGSVSRACLPDREAMDNPPKYSGFDMSFLHIGVSGVLGVTMNGQKAFSLGGAHRGLVAQCLNMTPQEALRLLSRASGGGFVAHPLAFIRAIERAEGQLPRAGQRDYRLLLLELERISLHLFDLEQTAYYGGIAALYSCCGHLREVLANLYQKYGLPRRLTDMVVLSTSETESTEAGEAALKAAASDIVACMRKYLPRLARLHGFLMRRFSGQACLPTETVWQHSVGGVAGRASGRAVDMRRHEAGMRLDALRAAAMHDGCVVSRGRQRLAEMRDSVILIKTILTSFALPDHFISPVASGEGLGVAEGARGDVWYWLNIENGRITSLHVRDPALPLLSAVSDIMRQEETWQKQGVTAQSQAFMLASLGLSPAGAAL